MERQIRRVGVGLLAAFLAVFFQLNYVQWLSAQDIASNRSNVRRLLREYSIKRGDIITSDNVTLATSRRTKGKLKYERLYPRGDLYGHITGYYSIIYGTARIEAAFNDELLGEGGVLTVQDFRDRFLGGGEEGNDVRLTIHSRLQRAAQQALGNQRGSVVALDPQTGEIRAMWNFPSFDPSPLASHDSREQRRYRRSLKPNDPTSPLISLATSRSYPPGSTFKVVVTAAALESGFTPRSTFPDPPALDLPLTDAVLRNYSRTACTGGGSIDLFTALEISCDTTYGILGLRRHNKIRDVSEAFGFNERIPVDVGTEASVFPDIADDSANLRAFAGIGQGDVSATPLQMALIAAGVANGGKVPRPRLVREIVDPNAGIEERFTPEIIGEPMSSRTARQVKDMMVAVVESGTGTAARMEGVKVAGKTGTAQTGIEGANPHTWFIAFAPADDPQLAVAVIVEHGGSFGSEATGGAVAAPIARALLEADRRIRGW
jgi:peptidoglycan glycosyltransferase